MAKAKKKKYNLKEKEFSCRLPGKKEQTYTALRADSAARRYVEEETKSKTAKLGTRVHRVVVTSEDGHKLTIPVRETIERAIVLVKNR